MGTDIINNKAIAHIDSQLREQPLVALLHEMKKELLKTKNENELR